MVVYHGTTQDRAKEILECKKILMTNEQIKRYEDTECGYVYVTDNLAFAIDFATRSIKKDETITGVVYKIIIDDNELLLDENDKNSFFVNDVEYVCYKVNRDLLIGKDAVSFLVKDYSYKTMDNEINDIARGIKTISDSEWQKMVSCS